MSFNKLKTAFNPIYNSIRSTISTYHNGQFLQRFQPYSNGYNYSNNNNGFSCNYHNGQFLQRYQSYSNGYNHNYNNNGFFGNYKWFLISPCAFPLISLNSNSNSNDKSEADNVDPLEEFMNLSEKIQSIMKSSDTVTKIQSNPTQMASIWNSLITYHQHMDTDNDLLTDLKTVTNWKAVVKESVIWTKAVNTNWFDTFAPNPKNKKRKSSSGIEHQSNKRRRIIPASNN
eukprot:126706_1